MLPLSIVVPTRDTAELVLACVASVERGVEVEHELIVVDDGGIDDTAARLAAAHPAVRLLRRESSGGFSVAANAGIATSRGALVLLLNSDAELREPQALASLVRAFAESPRLGIAGATLLDPDGSPQWSGGRRPTARWMFALASGLPSVLPRRAPSGHRGGRMDWVTGAALAVRRAVLEEIGLLDEGFAFYGQDLDLCWRAGDAGWQVQLLPEVRVHHHRGATVGANPGRLAWLWGDLVRAIHLRAGAAAAWRAALALQLGAALRPLLGARAAPASRSELRAALASARAAARGDADSGPSSARIPRLPARPLP